MSDADLYCSATVVAPMVEITKREVYDLGLSKYYIDHDDSKWDVPDVVAITATPIGALVHKEQNPHIIWKPDDVINEFNKCIEYGAVGVHTHSVGDQGRHITEVNAARGYLKSIIDPLKRKHGDNIVIDGGIEYYGESLDDNLFPVREGLYELVIINPSVGQFGNRLRVYSPKVVQEQAKYCEEHGVKVMLDIHDTGHIKNAKRWLIDNGILSKPTHWHIVGPCADGLIYSPNMKSTIDSLRYLADRIKEIDRDAIISVEQSGRASIYLITLAMLLGFDIRVGLHHTIWKYPHKNDLIASTAEVVRETVKIAESLGRRPANGREYRKILGM